MLILPVCMALVNLFGPVQAYTISVEHWHQVCPQCGASMVLDGGFLRRTPVEVGPFRVQQVRCSNESTCRKPGPKKESLIPSWLLPYQRQMALKQEEVVDAVDGRLWTMEQAAERIDVDPKTVSRWHSRFVGLVRIFDVLVCQLLAATQEFSFWVVDGTSRGISTGRQFLGQLRLLRHRRGVGGFSCHLAFLSWLWPRSFLPCRQTMRSFSAPEFLS